MTRSKRSLGTALLFGAFLFASCTGATLQSTRSTPSSTRCAPATVGGPTKGGPAKGGPAKANADLKRKKCKPLKAKKAGFSKVPASEILMGIP